MNKTIDLSTMGTADMYSLSLILSWLSDNGTAYNSLESIGYNPNSGEAYAIMENGNGIISSFGQPVSFIDSEENEITEADFNASL